jgi:hypothetical protein
MKRQSHTALLAALVAVVSPLMGSLAGCDGFSGQAGDKPEGFRLFEGRLQVPDDDLVGRQVTGLQMAALHIDAEGGIGVFPSAVFDPSVQRAEATFVATVAGDQDVVLVLQVPSGTQRGLGSFLGLYTFDGGESLVPRGEDDVDIGTLTVVRGTRVPADTTLTGGVAGSPATQTDSDGDGLTNDRDDNDDDDADVDANDTDVAGDGVDDALQRLSALPDDNGDGVPDAMQ